MRCSLRKISSLFASVLIVLGVGASNVHAADIAECPGTTIFVSWEPFLNTFGSGTYNAVSNAITGAKSQGYTALRRYTNNDNVKPNKKDPQAVYGSCTRHNWDTFANSAGIALFHAHGLSIAIASVSTRKEDAGWDWVDAGTDNNDMVVVQEANKLWTTAVHEDWVTRNFSPLFNQTDAIIMLSACETASSFASKIGGRAIFGYTVRVPIVNGPPDAELLFNRMNGTLPAGAQGTKRRAGDAIDAGGFTSDPVVLTANSKRHTTLCPSVDHATSANVSPTQNETVTMSGSGYVIFDTNLDSTTTGADASQVLMKDADISGITTISGQTWVGKNRINFNWSATAGYGEYGGYGSTFSVRMKVVADKAVGRLGKQKLDGGSYTTNGVAANGDNFTWVISGANQ